VVATRLTTPATVSRWLARNDPGGYWKTSLLTLAAVADRDASPSANPRGDLAAGLVRTPEGKPTALALVAREWAKGKTLPGRMDLRMGH
jgi:hypothetical protein